MGTCEKFNRELLLKHRDLIKENVPKQLYLEMNILSYYSLINDLDLYSLGSLKIAQNEILLSLQMT